MNSDKFKKELSSIFYGKILIVGIGNSLKSDDGFGPVLISRIEGRVRANCLDTGLAPENFIGKIIKLKPNTILFLDAVSMDEPPATIKLIQGDQIPHYGFSTHNMSPKLMIENIKSQIEVNIFMLGIQPKSLEFGEEISKEVLEKIVFLENTFMEILGKNEKQK